MRWGTFLEAVSIEQKSGLQNGTIFFQTGTMSLLCIYSQQTPSSHLLSQKPETKDLFKRILTSYSVTLKFAVDNYYCGKLEHKKDRTECKGADECYSSLCL